MEHVHEWVKLTALLIEVLAAAIMAGLIVYGAANWPLSGNPLAVGCRHYRLILAKSLLIGLELLIASDIVAL